MKPDKTKVFTEFAPETRFELRPADTAVFRAGVETEFERLKDQLLAEQLFLAKHTESYAPLRRAASEAAALAWSTLFPLLLFPALFEEKIAKLSAQTRRQKRIYTNNSQPFAA
jgi:hypothetical protein